MQLGTIMLINILMFLIVYLIVTLYYIIKGIISGPVGPTFVSPKVHYFFRDIGNYCYEKQVIRGSACLQKMKQPSEGVAVLITSLLR